VLDGIRPHYSHFSSIQTGAFHEFIADLTAILAALRTNSVRRVVADTSKGKIWDAEVISGLGKSSRFSIRNRHTGWLIGISFVMLEIIQLWKILRNWCVPHDCSAVLTGAMYEILLSLLN